MCFAVDAPRVTQHETYAIQHETYAKCVLQLYWQPKIDEIARLRDKIQHKLARVSHGFELVQRVCETAELRAMPTDVEDGIDRMNAIIQRYSTIDNIVCLQRVLPICVASMMRLKRVDGTAPSEDAVFRILAWASTHNEYIVRMPASELDERLKAEPGICLTV